MNKKDRVTEGAKRYSRGSNAPQDIVKVRAELPPLAKELEQEMRFLRPRFTPASLLLRSIALDEVVRLKALEFVDVLPRLSSYGEISDRLLQLFGPDFGRLPPIFRLGIFSTRVPLLRTLTAFAAEQAVRRVLAPYFIVKNESTARAMVAHYRSDGTIAAFDYLGELVTSEKDVERFLALYLQTMKEFSGNPDRPFHIAVKISSLFPFFGPENYEESKRQGVFCLSRILETAQKTNSFVTIDAEHYHFRNLITDIFIETINKPAFQDVQNVGIAVQAYFTDALVYSCSLIDEAESRGTPFLVRLVKGAYWDTEIALASQKNWPVPVFCQKRQTDNNFEKVLGVLFTHWHLIHTSPATHNPESIAFAFLLARRYGLDRDPRFMFQVLYGLGEPARRALRARNLPVLSYVPVTPPGGNLIDVMSYFARRILENTSQDGFLVKLISS